MANDPTARCNIMSLQSSAGLLPLDGRLEYPGMMPHSGGLEHRARGRRPARPPDPKALMPATLSVDRVSKVFPSRAGGPPLEALRDVSFRAEPGEFIALIGPSGCGKTTLLRIVHGLEPATQGHISFDGRIVSAPEQSRAVIFQGFNLFPWRTVVQNIAFGLEVRGDEPDSRDQRVADMIG